MDKLSDFKVPLLKRILKGLNLPTIGTRAELISRLSAMDPESLSRAIADATNVMTIESEDEMLQPQQGDIAAASESNRGIDNREERRENSDSNNLLRRKLELLRRENAVLQRELRLAEHRESSGLIITATSQVPVTSAVRIKEISDLLADFAGDKDTFDAWKGQAEILRTTYRLNEDAMKMLLSSRLKGKAREWFHSTPTHLQLTVNELFEQMDRMFNHRRSKLELRRNFEKCVWQPTESFSTYFHTKVVANKASIAKDELVDYLIDGIPDSRMRDQARIQQFRTEDDLLKAFANLSFNRHIQKHSNVRKMENPKRRTDSGKRKKKNWRTK